MKIELREINSPSEFSSAPLRNRATVSTKAAFTKHYAAMSGNIEVAFVALDIPENKSYLHVYELLVEPQQRRRGYGALIIEKCRLIAIQDRFKTINLIPRPIEVGSSEHQLRAWYSGLGFSQSPNQSDLLEIIL